MSIFMKELMGSMILMFFGIFMFSICCNIDPYQASYYYSDKTNYMIVHAFFWVGIAFFITGILNLIRVSVIRRTEFRGLMLRTRPMVPGTVTVIGTAYPVENASRLQPPIQPYYQGQDYYTGQQCNPMQPTDKVYSLPPMPPPYTPYEQK